MVVFGIATAALLVLIGCLLLFLYGRKNAPPMRPGIVVLIPGARLYGVRPSPALAARIDTAFRYGGVEALYLATGGKGEDETISEGEAIRRELLRRGVPPEHILTETSSTSTFENIAQVLPLLRERRVEAVVVSTNRFHVARTGMLVRRFGLTAYGLPAPTPPSAVVKSYLRECAAFIKSFLIDRP